MSAPVKKKCPSCRKLQLERLIGIGAGFIIKGGSASVQAEAAEKAKDEKDRKASAKLTETKSTDSKSADSKAADSKKPKDSKGDTQPKSSPKAESDPSPKLEKKPEPEKNEKKLSGSTSTPTHKAREGRGVGNLVDKAKRRAQEASKKKTKKK